MSNQTKIVKGLFAGLGVALIMPVFFGDPASFDDRSGGDPLRNLIYDFQTLIGGALAVAAAWWTVRTMEKTDIAAERRHSEQVALILRADKLAVQRAIYPQMTGLSGIGMYIETFKAQMLSQNTYRLQLHYIISHAFLFRGLARDILELLNLDQLKEGSRLFDGNLTFKLHWLRQQADSLEGALDNLGDELRFVNPETVLQDPGATWAVEPAYGAIVRLAEEIPTVVNLMEQAGEQYGALK